jgi:uncharacterized protein YkwD
MAVKVKIIAVLSFCAALTIPVGAVAAFPARADDFRAAIYGGVSDIRQSCGAIGDDPRLTAAAQRLADDLVINGVEGGHIASDGSSPRARILDAGYIRPGNTSEIIYWGSGSHANPSAPLEWWMHSPPHQAIILNCAFTEVGFAIAWARNMVVVVGDFAGR